jgi:hypothetical protein
VSAVKNVNKKLKLDIAKKSTRVRPPSPGTPEFAKLEPITFSKYGTSILFFFNMSTIDHCNFRRKVDISSDDETKSAKRYLSGYYVV